MKLRLCNEKKEPEICISLEPSRTWGEFNGAYEVCLNSIPVIRFEVETDRGLVIRNLYLYDIQCADVRKLIEAGVPMMSCGGEQRGSQYYKLKFKQA